MENTSLVKSKVKTGIILTLALALLIALDYFAPVAFDIFLLGISIIASAEFGKLVTKSGYLTQKIVPQVACLLIFALFLLTYLLGVPSYAILLLEIALVGVIYLVSYLLDVWILRKKATQNEFRIATNMSVNSFAFFRANNTLTCIIYPSMLVMFLYFINHISEIGLSLSSKVAGVPYGLFGLILVFAISCMTDTFAMLFGCLIKGKKLCPKISPKKTISGAIFGLVGGVVGAVATYLIFNLICGGAFRTLAFWQFIIVGLIGSVLAQAGDLFESYAKRRASVKEAGDFFGSHGGVIDRFDSIVFVAPFVFLSLILLMA